jgi:hypothetical protein
METHSGQAQPVDILLVEDNPGACDDVGGAFRPKWREGPVRTRSSNTILCGTGVLLLLRRQQRDLQFSPALKESSAYCKECCCSVSGCATQLSYLNTSVLRFGLTKAVLRPRFAK